MKNTVDMPPVSKCQVTECAYNKAEACHARAITVGDGVHPGCDTYMKSSIHIRNDAVKAGVGACKVTGCSHNADFECSANAIQVGFSGKSVDCLTFSPR
jgi:hypothetical protein